MLSVSKRQALCVASILFLLSLGMTDQASAWRRRGNRYYNTTTDNTNTNNTNTDNTNTNNTNTDNPVAEEPDPTISLSKQIAPKLDPATSSYTGLPVSYYYDPVMEEEGFFDGSLRVHLCIGEFAEIKQKMPLVAEVQITDLQNSDRQQSVFVPVTLEEPHLQDRQKSPPARSASVRYAFFDLENGPWEQPLIQPARVYRLFVNLHRKAESQGRETLIGRVPYPYYTATSGSTRLDRARKTIVMRTFKEFYYRLNGWRTGESYPMDCYAYYMWATGFCTVGANNGRTQLHNLFDAEHPYNLGSNIPELSSQAPIHGDYVRMPGHSFMLLSYDPERKQVWTMEGNFNSTVEVVIRNVAPSWTVGHLRDRHILPNLFRIFSGRPRLFPGFGG